MTGGNKRKQEAPSQSALQDDPKHANSDEAGGRGARGKRALEGDETSKGRARGRSKKNRMDGSDDYQTEFQTPDDVQHEQAAHEVTSAPMQMVQDPNMQAYNDATMAAAAAAAAAQAQGLGPEQQQVLMEQHMQAALLEQQQQAAQAAHAHMLLTGQGDPNMQLVPAEMQQAQAMLQQQSAPQIKTQPAASSGRRPGRPPAKPRIPRLPQTLQAKWQGIHNQDLNFLAEARNSGSVVRTTLCLDYMPQELNMSEEDFKKYDEAPLELEIPLMATVGWVKREIMRRSNHHLQPAMQTLKLNNDGEPDGDILLVDEGDGPSVRTMASYGIKDGSKIWLSIEVVPLLQPILNHQSPSLPQLPQLAYPVPHMHSAPAPQAQPPAPSQQQVQQQQVQQQQVQQQQQLLLQQAQQMQQPQDDGTAAALAAQAAAQAGHDPANAEAAAAAAQAAAAGMAVGSAGFPSALAISAQPMSNSSQAYTLGAMYSNGSNKRARWTLDEIEALVEGCEKYGPGEWKRICSEYNITKSGSQAKDKWRNLCISATTGREDRGLSIPEHVKARVRQYLSTHVEPSELAAAGLTPTPAISGIPASMQSMTPMQQMQGMEADQLQQMQMALAAAQHQGAEADVMGMQAQMQGLTQAQMQGVQ